MHRDFHYYSGEIVCVGDLVRVYGRLNGYIAEVVMPGTEQALACNCPDGYVCTVSEWDGKKSSSLWTPPDGKFWEDLDLVQRANKPT